jgi:outer membrane protein assembly factor BamA
VTRTLRCVPLLVAAAALPAAAQTTPADSVEVQSVDFAGVDAFAEAELATAIVTTPTQCLAVKPLCWLGIGVDRQYLDTRALGADVVRLRVFYYQRGYREARVSVDTARSGDDMRVTFTVDEGRPVTVASLAYAGADSLPRDVTRELPLEVGAPLSMVAYEAARDTMRVRLRNRGYAQGEVLGSYLIPRDSSYTAHVEFSLLPGPLARFGDIEVVGAQRVSPAVVRRMLTFQPGDVYSLDARLRSQRNLFAQELFRHAEIRDLPGTPEDTVIAVRVQVNEGDLHRVRTGIGVNTAEYLNAEGRWISRSFFGGARRLELRGRITNLLADQLQSVAFFDQPDDDLYTRLSGQLAADFTQPWLLGPLNSLNAGLYAERRSLPDVYVRTAAGGYVSLTRAVGPGVLFSLGYRPELAKLETAEGDRIFCISFVACDEEDIGALRQLNMLSPVTASYVQDRSNSFFAPSRGYIVRLDAEYASALTGSDFHYGRFVADITDYHTVTPGVVFAARLRPGLAYAPIAEGLGVHPSKRFFAGGPNSVRGFSQYRLGPKLLVVDAVTVLADPVEEGGAGCNAQQINAGTCDVTGLAEREPDAFRARPVGGAVLLEGNVEVRFPVYRENLRGAAFVDFGQVWQDADAVDLGMLAWTPGLGVRYFSAIGPIRIDVGYNGTGGELRSAATTEVGVLGSTGACLEIGQDETHELSQLCNLQTLRPLEPVFWNPRSSLLDRFQLHFSIGQAF